MLPLHSGPERPKSGQKSFLIFFAIFFKDFHWKYVDNQFIHYSDLKLFQKNIEKHCKTLKNIEKYRKTGIFSSFCNAFFLIPMAICR